MEVCDVVAFVSDPDSTISPSEGVDSDLDRREAIFHTKKCSSLNNKSKADSEKELRQLG